MGASCGVGPASEQAGNEPGPFAMPFDITEGFFCKVIKEKFRTKYIIMKVTIQRSV